MEGRKRVKDQLMRIDNTYAEVDFNYTNAAGKQKSVRTLEELEYPRYFAQTVEEEELDTVLDEAATEPDSDVATQVATKLSELQKGHVVVMENQRGISYDNLFGPHLSGANHITITDPYIRLFYQARNLMELMETIVRHKKAEDEVVVELITVEDEYKGEQQREWLSQIQNSMLTAGVKFSFSFDNSGSQHARHIVTDHGWKISLDRGLDIFQQYDMNDAFKLSNRVQTQRPCKAFEITYIKV